MLSFQPDAVILDIMASGYDGRILCTEIKNNAELKNIPIILFSAISELKSTAKEGGGDDYIHKPSDVAEMISKLKRLTNYWEITIICCVHQHL